MQTTGRISPYLRENRTRKFAQFPGTRRHIPRLSWPRLWGIRRVHLVRQLLLMAGMGAAAVPVQGQTADPRITLAASRDTIIGGLETLVLTATREAPLDAPLAVTLQVTQEQNWLSRTSYQLNFAAGGSTANLNLSRVLFSSDVRRSGTLTATVDSVSGNASGRRAPGSRQVGIVFLSNPHVTSGLEADVGSGAPTDGHPGYRVSVNTRC